MLNSTNDGFDSTKMYMVMSNISINSKYFNQKIREEIGKAKSSNSRR